MKMVGRLEDETLTRESLVGPRVIRVTVEVVKMARSCKSSHVLTHPCPAAEFRPLFRWKHLSEFGSAATRGFLGPGRFGAM